MRVQNAEEVATALFDPNLKPNLPAGKAKPPVETGLAVATEGATPV
jgi:hypothetical protein